MCLISSMRLKVSALARLTPLLIAVLIGPYVGTTAAAEWPGWRGNNGDGIWREDRIVDRLPAGQIPIKWRTPISSGYSGPTVAGGRVFVSDRITEPTQRERVL